MRIQDEDCDVEPLSTADFSDHLEDGESIKSEAARIIGPKLPEHIQYVLDMIDMTKACR